MRKILILITISIWSFLLFSDDQTKTMAIFDITNKYGFVSDDTEKLTMLIFSEVSQLENLQLVERSELNKAIKEKNMTENGIMKSADTKRFIRITGADRTGDQPACI